MSKENEAIERVTTAKRIYEDAQRREVAAQAAARQASEAAHAAYIAWMNARSEAEELIRGDNQN